MIGTIARFLGFDTLIVYALIAALAGGGFYGYGAYKYHAGKSAGVQQERIMWEEQRRKMIAQAEAERIAKQAQIDRIEADYLALQEKLNQERAEAALEEAIRKENADAKPSLPRSIGQAINGVR